MRLLTCLAVLFCAPTTPIYADEVADFIIQLKDKDDTVRLKAAKELGKLKAKAKEAIPALTAERAPVIDAINKK